MFPGPDDRFESFFVPVAGETVLQLARHSGLDSETRLYRSDDVGATFTPLTALKWRLPYAGAELIAKMLPIGTDEVLVTTNRGRIYRGHAGEPLLVDWSQGLPPLLAGSSSPTIGRVGDAWLAFFGDCTRVARPMPPGPCCRPMRRPTAPGSMHCVGWRQRRARSGSLCPWGPGEWVGTDSATLFIAGPGRPIFPIWRNSDGRVSFKRLDVGATAVYVSQNNATLAATGIAVRPDGAHLLRLA